ncbi:MAG: alcohol dehydrogenase GroES domain protein, partial [Microbacteriaceae bacterium]|nr:alcohol dehydrogenase GroES domain protein [Microbacteriaceae bacterium]
MPKAVRFSEYGGPEVLEIAEVQTRPPGADEVTVSVVTAGINPGELA